MNSNNILTTHQAAAQLGITHSLICRYCRVGRLPATRFGKSWVIRADDLATFAQQPRSVGNPNFPKTLDKSTKIL